MHAVCVSTHLPQRQQLLRPEQIWLAYVGRVFFSISCYHDSCRPTGGKGDLILEVELLFPTHITETQKMLIKSAFFLPANPSKEQHKALRQYEQAFKDPLQGW